MRRCLFCHAAFMRRRRCRMPGHTLRRYTSGSVRAWGAGRRALAHQRLLHGDVASANREKRALAGWAAAHACSLERRAGLGEQLSPPRPSCAGVARLDGADDQAREQLVMRRPLQMDRALRPTALPRGCGARGCVEQLRSSRWRRHALPAASSTRGSSRGQRWPSRRMSKRRDWARSARLPELPGPGAPWRRCVGCAGTLGRARQARVHALYQARMARLAGLAASFDAVLR